MTETTFFVLFGVTWLAAIAYVVSAWRLMARVRHLKAEGRASEAPDPFTNPLAVLDYLGWLLTGRYAELGDEVAGRRAGIARVLFVVGLPLIIALFFVAFTRIGGWSQPM